MLEKLGNLKKLYGMKRMLSGEEVTVERDGVKVVVSGEMKVQKIKLHPKLDLQKQEKLVKEAVNEAFKKVQTRVAQKMMQKPSQSQKV